MLPVRLRGDEIAVGAHRRIESQRTLRIPADDGCYPLPPGLGCPPRAVAGLDGRAPDDWRRRGGAVSPSTGGRRPGSGPTARRGGQARQGHTVEEQLTGSAARSGIQLGLIQPRPGLFPERPPSMRERYGDDGMGFLASDASMGFCAGGRMRQEVFPDSADAPLSVPPLQVNVVGQPSAPATPA